MKQIRDSEHDYDNEYPLYICIIGIAATVTICAIVFLHFGG